MDSKFLQMQHKDVIKQQDVIYGTTHAAATRGSRRDTITGLSRTRTK